MRHTHPVDPSHIIYFPQNKKVNAERPWEVAGEQALHFTLAFVIDLPRGDDFVEHGGERLVLSNDSRRDERRHDELPLTDVGFHGYPGREASGEQVTNKQTNKQMRLSGSRCTIIPPHTTTYPE